MKKYLSIIVSILLSLSCFAESTTGSAELTVHLLDYLAKDYGTAVQNGIVVSESEYAEQIEFVGLVKKNAENTKSLNNQKFILGIEKLSQLIGSKAQSSEVSKLARLLQQDAIKLAKIQVAPTEWPNLSLGAKLFQTNCMSCHGTQGKGDGPVGAGLEPKPTNFYDSDVVWNSSPYKFYNTIRLGVPGTGMAAFPHFSDQEVWALAFYLKSIPYENTAKSNVVNIQSISLSDAASLTDAEIAVRIKDDQQEVFNALATLRNMSTNHNENDYLQTAENLLSESLQFAENGNFNAATTTALRAYLEGVELVEPKLKANIPGAVEQIETLMSDYRSTLEHKESIEQIRIKKELASKKLQELREQLSTHKMSTSLAFAAVFAIFLREGFEAILIIVVLISILRAMRQPEAIKWIHFGWATAIGLGLIAWFASGYLLKMSGLSRELLEGSISILAVAVLFYVGVWLHRYSEVKKWRAFLEEKLRDGLSKGSYVGLAVVSFMAVFREAFEVVLFLRAIWIDLDFAGQTIASSGIISATLLLVVFSYFAIKGSRKLPIGILFKVCAATMLFLAVVLAGKGIHSLQEAGFVSVTPIGFNFRFDVFGVYPSVQTLSAQLFVIATFSIVLWRNRRKI